MPQAVQPPRLFFKGTFFRLSRRLARLRHACCQSLFLVFVTMNSAAHVLAGISAVSANAFVGNIYSWSGEALHAETSCSLDWHNFDDSPVVSHATALWYKDNEAYDKWSAVGLAGANRFHKWMPYFFFKAFNVTEIGAADRVGSADGHLKFGTCQKQSTRGTWHTDRVGPFRSTGGYDWWQLSYRHIELLRPDMGINAHVLTAVDANGDMLGYPPVHMHHVHLISSTLDTYDLPVVLWENERMVEHHGDWVFLDGTLDSYGPDYGSSVKWFTAFPTVNVELNDVRPPRSPPMLWYFQLSVRVAANDAAGRALSVMKTHQPGPLCFNQLGCSVLTVQIDPAVDTWLFYDGRMPHAGQLVDAVFHAHQSAHHATMLVTGSVDFLRHTPTLVPPGHDAREAILTVTSGVANNVLLREAIVSRIVDPASSRYVICETEGQQTQIDGHVYDRSRVPHCVDWRFDEAEHFTVVSFFGPTSFGVAPVTGPFTQHSIWFLTYFASDGHSHYDMQFNAPTPMGSFSGLALHPSEYPTLIPFLLGLGTPSSLAVFSTLSILLLAFVCCIYQRMAPVASSNPETPSLQKKSLV
jgi:hypothetical protein